jgi:hypothetical protein
MKTYVRLWLNEMLGLSREPAAICPHVGIKITIHEEAFDSEGNRRDASRTRQPF